MKSKEVNTLTDKIIAELKTGKSAQQCFQEAISGDCDPADLVRVEACVFGEAKARDMAYSLQDSDEITALLGAMSPRAASSVRALKAAERGFVRAFAAWLQGAEDD